MDVVHIADSNVDPSLQSTQRKLKKAKLTDELNVKLAHRPGPLELVEQRILEADDPIKVAIKGKLFDWMCGLLHKIFLNCGYFVVICIVQ